VLGCKSLDYVVISHFHVDHLGYVGYGGLWNLVETQGFTVGTTLVRNYNTHLGDISSTFTNWKTYLEGTGQAKLHPAFAVEGTGQVDLGPGVTFEIVTVNGNGALLPGDFHLDTSPPSENDYNLGAVLRLGAFDEWIGGDLDGQYQKSSYGYTYHDIELGAARDVGDVDVYKVNHHGSSHSSSATFLSQLDPEVSIVTVGNSNTYGHPAQEIMDRLLATSTIYMTERGDTNTNIGSAIVAGNIVIKTTNGSTYTVNGTSFTATEPIRTDSDGDGYFAEADPNDGSFLTVPSPSGGCDPLYQTCTASIASCQATAGQVLINEVLPSPSNNGTEWMELYNTTSSPVNIGYCIVDDIAGGSAPYAIPASTILAAHGFWTLDRTSYFNNSGDSVRFLKEDGSTSLDTYSFGSTGYDVSWYRSPNGGPWAGSPTASTTKGKSNTGTATTATLSVSKTGTGSGTVTSNPAGINCGLDCSEVYSYNTVVTLTASPNTGSTFTGWSGGGCSGTGNCILTMTAAKSVTASFVQAAQQTFADVPPTHQYYQDIEILYANGLTGGCATNPLRFCPDQIMNRGQAAVFILRANFGPSYVPPAATHIFQDDWSKGTWAEPWAEGMRNEGLSAGCLANPLKYCPWDQIPREQAVIFALRMKYGTNYTPPPATGTLFADMTNPGYYATAWAEKAYTDGIIPNCGTSGGKPKFCPTALVSRGLAAYMIVRAKSLTMP
jgi:hypothetical protein